MTWHIATLIAAGCFALHAQPESPDVHDACEFLSTAEQFDGQMVRVRGVVDVGPEYLLTPAPGVRCPNRIEVGGISFASRIMLADPKVEGVVYKPNFRIDGEAYSELLTLLRARSDGVCIIATVSGMAETRATFARLGEARARLWHGFGLDEASPTQILVRRYEDFKIVPGPCKVDRGTYK